MADTTRRDLKTLVANLLSTTPGVKQVDTFTRKIETQVSYPLIIVSLPKSDEEPLTIPRPNSHKKITFTVHLQIFWADSTPDGSGQLDFDDLLGAVDEQIRSSPNLSNGTVNSGAGIVLAHGIDKIETVIGQPQLLKQTVVLMAIKQYDVVIQVTG